MRGLLKFYCPYHLSKQSRLVTNKSSVTSVYAKSIRGDQISHERSAKIVTLVPQRSVQRRRDTQRSSFLFGRDLASNLSSKIVIPPGLSTQNRPGLLCSTSFPVCHPPDVILRCINFALETVSLCVTRRNRSLGQVFIYLLLFASKIFFVQS